MKLTFLGTGSSRGIPREGHTDPLCRAARAPGSKSCRRRSSAVLEHNGKNILIDVSPDFLEQAKHAKLARIEAILLTHAHSDAMGGLSDLKKWMENSAHPPISLYAHPATIKSIKKNLPPLVRPIQAKEFANSDIAGIKVKFIPVNHGVHHIATLGFVFDKKLFFASDLDGTSARAKKIISGAKILILDGAFWDWRRLKGHFAAPETIVFAKKLNPKKLYITQSGHTYPPHEIAQREINKMAQKQNCTFPVQLAYDGMKINV